MGSGSALVTPPGQSVSARTTVDTATLDTSLRRELSVNLGAVREKIKAVAEECMQELTKAQLLLKEKEREPTCTRKLPGSDPTSPQSALLRRARSPASQDGTDPPDE